ncbi:Protein of unknown function [Pricia antarctica]|uniref:DUF2490 domain-containing protein n=1 Tax=Pricia antarctica TaxID=641691 RepID=A0A1G6Y1R0_9FLAO|nr:DUF2490 domain-containing protein [Pricia antarctica]SDD84434.1 Protein of unknown function [Pricia antarctica]
MTIFFTKGLLLVFALFLGHTLSGQANFTGNFEPNVAMNYKVATNYKHIFQITQRSTIYDEKLQLRARQLEISHFSELKIAYNQSIALGLLYQFREAFDGAENELRFTQQYDINHKRGSLRFGERLRAEQRIRPSLTTHRFRYRLAMDLPISGEKLDVGEPYFVVSTESLLSVASGKSSQFDQRLTVNIGWLVNHTIKLEVGTQYRIVNYTQSIENALLLLTSLVLSL